MSVIQTLFQLKEEVNNRETYINRLISEKLKGIFSDINIKQVGYSEYQVEAKYQENIYLFEVYQQFRDDDYFPNHLVYRLCEVSYGERKIQTSVYLEHKDVFEQKLHIYLRDIDEIKSEEEIKHKQLVEAFSLIEQDLKHFDGFSRIENLLDVEQNLLEVPGLLRIKRMASNAFSILVTEYDEHYILVYNQELEKVKRSWSTIYQSILMYHNKYKKNKTGEINLFELYEYVRKHARKAKIVEQEQPFSFAIKNIIIGGWDKLQANVSLFYHEEMDRMFIHIECLGEEYNEEKEMDEIYGFMYELFKTFTYQ